MKTVALFGFLGLVGANYGTYGAPGSYGAPQHYDETAEQHQTYDTDLTALQTGTPGDHHRHLIQSMPYAKGHSLFHDNFSPYDYNYYHERRHRVNFLVEQQESQKRLHWEGQERQKAAQAWEQQHLTQAALPHDPTNAAPNTPSIGSTYEAPRGYPEGIQGQSSVPPYR